MKPGILQKLGYAWLALPIENLAPLNLLENTEENIFRRISNVMLGRSKSANLVNANLFSLFPKDVRGDYPTIGEPKNVAFFKGYDVLDISSSVNLNISDLIPSIDKSTISANLKKASKLLYSFSNPQHIEVDNEVLLEEHLNICQHVKKAIGFIEKLKNGKLYVITEVLQTKRFTVQNASDLVIDGDLTVEVIQQFIESKSHLSVQNSKDQTIEYKGDSFITFALKANRIIYNEKEKNFTLKKTRLNVVRGDSAESLEPASPEGLFIYIT